MYRSTKVRANGCHDVQAPSSLSALTIHAVELSLLAAATGSNGSVGRGTTWLSKGLKVEDAQIYLAQDLKALDSQATEIQRLALAQRTDRLVSDISVFILEASGYLGTDCAEGVTWDASDNDDGPEQYHHTTALSGQQPHRDKIPLPSTLGMKACKQFGILGLRDNELKLREGQANDALHEIQIALANKQCHSVLISNMP